MGVMPEIKIYIHTYIHTYVQNFQRRLTHMLAVTCGSLSQHCQWLSPARQTKSAKDLL